MKGHDVNKLLIAIVGIPLVLVLIGVLIATSTDVLHPMTVDAAIQYLESQNYAVFSPAEFDLVAKEATTAKEATAQAAVETADSAVEAAEAAVIAAQIAAAKVDLFNSAVVYLLPDVTNVTITLTAGDTNVWSSWAEVVDSTNVTLSSKFALSAGYINDMYIFDHSAVDKVYSIELAYGANKTILGRMMWHTSYKDAVQIKSRHVPAGQTIYYRMMCSGANGATAKVGFRYFYE